MGLLDAMYNGNTFAGDGNSLLDFLRNAQMQQDQYKPTAPGNSPWPESPSAPPQPAGPIAVGDYQMPRMGSMAQFTPPPAEPAAIPQNAQPAQGQLPMQPAQQPQSVGGNALTGLQSFLNGGGLISSIRGAMEGKRADPRGMAQEQENQTAQFLVSKGMDPAMAKTVVADPALARAVIPQIMGIGGSTDDIKEYQFAKKEDPTLTFNKFMSQKKAVSGEYGMTPIWGVGKDGKPAVIQLGKSGDAKQSILPEGFNLARDPIKVEGPTGTSILDPQTRQTIGFIPKDVSGAAKAKEIGEAEGQALVNLPTTIATAETALKTIKQLEEHPGKKSWGAFGVGAMLPDVPGTATRGFAALVDQVKGQNFMTAFQSLKGAGAITEQEGAKAEKAQARLDRAQSESDFDTALKDLKEVIAAGMARARQKAGMAGQPAASASPNASLKAKYGLD